MLPSLLRRSRKAQPSGTMAGILVMVITILIVMYILFLPPSDRASLLGEPNPGGSPTNTGTGTSSNPFTKGTILFSEAPGRLDFVKENSFDHTIPSFYLTKFTNAKSLATENPFYIKNGWFDKQSKTMSFSVPDLENTNNIVLSFKVDRHRGMLTIKLNQQPVYQEVVSQQDVGPLTLPKALLQQTNQLSFEVDGVGGKFWTTNEYSVSNLQILGEVTDISNQEAQQSFFVGIDEERLLEKAYLQFYPDCTPAKVGQLTVALNGRTISSTLPECGVLNKVDLSPSALSAGKNTLTFRTEAGSYLLDRILVKTSLQETAATVYYFDLDGKLFAKAPEEKAVCGQIDGVCPAGCSEDADKDCCFNDNKDAYWCDVLPSDSGDRCVGYVDAPKCSRCLSGYEDRKGDPPKACKGLCGDDTDNSCPAGCSVNYDANCCFSSAPSDVDFYFCYDLPTNGVSATCRQDLRKGECDICPTGYKKEGGSLDADCSTSSSAPTEDQLLSQYNLELVIQFVDDSSTKKADVYLNGHLFQIETRNKEYRRSIDAFVQSGNNALKIIPRSSLDIVKMEVRLI
ncbi:hypothetical protein HZB02_05465 [Candidatus Woesearchaeota archaeon]|nr:hypothetical protein [Candidatus Woesearchaeota archaeon]